jgi:hypothetical protein
VKNRTPGQGVGLAFGPGLSYGGDQQDTTMNATPSHTDRPTQVRHHPSFRGLRVEQNLLSPFTMYTVELDSLGLFISDSSLEAFNMAFEALFNPGPQTQFS